MWVCFNRLDIRNEKMLLLPLSAPHLSLWRALGGVEGRRVGDAVSSSAPMSSVLSKVSLTCVLSLLCGHHACLPHHPLQPHPRPIHTLRCCNRSNPTTLAAPPIAAVLIYHARGAPSRSVDGREHAHSSLCKKGSIEVQSASH